ncbi:MAG: hypothetical protein A2Y80_09170 [Deltaproteobacteria bacterium RBG_13_58_19]|jgi:hypothetical protein|nr:MAG: hypothetical protein A2Y80_09170 [Deltaproteobacteria bacterium RBG_13_58_19]
MQVTLNDQTLPVDLSHLRNLEEVLLELNEKFIPEGEQLFQVEVNGEFFTERYPRESRYVALGEVSTLGLKTVSDADMARAILTDAASQALTLIQALEKSAALFRLAAEDEANHYFAQVLEALRWLLQTGEGACQVLKVDLGQVRSPQLGDVSEFLKRFQDLLDEMLQVYEEEDYILLADLMEYELLPLVQEWQKILSLISHR